MMTTSFIIEFLFIVASIAILAAWHIVRQRDRKRAALERRLDKLRSDGT